MLCHSGRVRTRRRLGFGVAVVVALGAATLTACAAGPSQRPPVAVVDDDLARQQAPATTTGQPPPSTADDVPVTDLDWRDCTAQTRSSLTLPAGPAGLVLECATLPVQLDPGVSGQLDLGLLRARLPSTPMAAPLVLTTGADAPSTATLARIATAADDGLLAARPVVALDRRGTGGSTPLSCLTPAQRAALVEVDPDRGGATSDDALLAGRDATQECTDVLTPAELSLSTDRASDDLEALRTRWGVERLSLYGAGEGAGVAVRYAVAHPTRLAHLVLDSPTDPTADVASAADTAAAGAEAAFDAFAARCVALGCPLGADPRAAVTALLEQARAGTLAAAGSRRVLSSGTLLATLRTALATPGSPGLVDALATAGAGDASAVLALADATVLDRGLDGRFAVRCSDASLRPTPDQVGALVATFRSAHPLFGAQAAGDLAECLSWPTPADPDRDRSAGAAAPGPGRRRRRRSRHRRAGRCSHRGRAEPGGREDRRAALAGQWAPRGERVELHPRCGGHLPRRSDAARPRHRVPAVTCPRVRPRADARHRTGFGANVTR